MPELYEYDAIIQPADDGGAYAFSTSVKSSGRAAR